MKRSEALEEIQWAGWHGDTQKAAAIVRQKNIGAAASRRAFLNGQKMKERKEPCGCADCAGKSKK